MKKIFALFLVISLALSLCACGTKNSFEEENTTDVITLPEETLVEETTIEETTVEETTVVDEPEVSDISTTMEETESIKRPESTDEIIDFYNNAVNNAYDSKVGFEKERYTDGEKMDAGPALKAFKSLVFKFMGIGAENKYSEKVTKGNWDSDTKKHFLRKSTLTSSDVTSATCNEKDGKYTIILNVKGGSSVGSESNNSTNAPIDKCGICVGNEDKGYYDHKTGPVIYDAIAGTYSGAKINESYSGAKVTAVIDSDGKLVSLTVEYAISCNIDIGIVGKATATGNTHIIYKNFVY